MWDSAGGKNSKDMAHLRETETVIQVYHKEIPSQQNANIMNFPHSEILSEHSPNTNLIQTKPHNTGEVLSE